MSYTFSITVFFTDDSESVQIKVFFFDLFAYLQADSRASASDVNTDACGSSKLVSLGIVVELVCLITLKSVPHSDFRAIDEYMIVIIECFEYCCIFCFIFH